MKRFVLLLSCCYLSCFLPFFPSSADAQDFDADKLLRFADSLFQEGDYLNAVNEYKRYLFLYPDSNQGDFIQLHIAAAYQNIGRFREAIEAYGRLIETYPKSPFVEKARTNTAQCQLLAGDHATAVASLRQFLSDYPESELAPRAQFIIGTIYMERKDWTSAAQEWQKVKIRYPQTPFGEMGERLAYLAQREESLPRRSPAIAGLLSAVVPGLGQVYGGRFSDGVYALFAVGITSGWTAYYIDQDRNEIAIPLGVIDLFFYLSNVYRGVQSAKAFNQQQEEEFLEGLRTQIYNSNLFGASDSSPKEISLRVWRTHF